MATEPIATVLSRRCSSCGALYPHEEEHACAGGGTAATVPMAPVGGLAETLAQPAVTAAAPGSAPPLPDTVPMPASLRAPGAAAAKERGGLLRRPSPPVELVGLVLGDRYEIKERISAGGMGVVYKARHIILESPVAVKVLLRPQDSTAQRRFLQEAKVASAIRHPNTVYISDFGVLADGRSYLVMEFLQGPTLAKVLRSGRLEPVRACKIALQIAQGLQAVHARGIVHRELSAPNSAPGKGRQGRRGNGLGIRTASNVYCCSPQA